MKAARQRVAGRDPKRGSRAAGDVRRAERTPVATAGSRETTPAPVVGIPVGVTSREGVASDGLVIHSLIVANLEAGHLLPRRLDELTLHAHRFLIIEHNGGVAGCAELAPLSNRVAEIRSLVIDPEYRQKGLGARLIRELASRALRHGYEKLCAFTHDPTHFVRLGFSIVPHVWLPEKIATDCHSCAAFRRCGQTAVLLTLNRRTGGQNDELA